MFNVLEVEFELVNAKILSNLIVQIIFYHRLSKDNIFKPYWKNVLNNIISKIHSEIIKIELVNRLPTRSMKTVLCSFISSISSGMLDLDNPKHAIQR